jgi:hypothetical protein
MCRFASKFFGVRKMVTLAVLAAGSLSLASQPSMAQTDAIQFDLVAHPKNLACLQSAPNVTPKAHITVHRGKLADTLTIQGQGIKPGLQFDMFTVQRSALLSDGTVDPLFTNFGFAWYQSDLTADSYGRINANIKTILLDQIFGFDPDLSPNNFNAFHVGFWFNDPNAAVACGFDATKPTPFNGEHKAGPVAMISVPDATTNLGPLCTDPNTGTNPPTCNP